MKLILVIMLGIFTALSVGCMNEHEAKEATAQNLQNPELVGTTKDGLKIYRYIVAMPHGNHAHYVYRFGDLDTTTVNYTVKEGKSSRNMVLVIVDGKTNQIETGNSITVEVEKQ